MHIITVIKNPNAEDEYRAVCEEGDFTSAVYGTESQAREVGLRHKEIKDGNPNA